MKKNSRQNGHPRSARQEQKRRKFRSRTIIIVFAVLVLGSLAWWWGSNVQAKGSTQALSTSAKGALTTPEYFYDFGTISMALGNVTHRFTITNSTRAAVNLTTVNTSCMCTKAYLETPSGEKGPFGMEGMNYVPPANETIKPGETREVKVVFDPKAHGPSGVGNIERTVNLIDAAGRTLQLGFKAYVTP